MRKPFLWLINHHWAIIITLGTVIILIQTVEHLSAPGISLFYAGEVTLIIALLVITGVLINQLKEFHKAQNLEIQMDLARDLHDTIGQNISYLRLKLDVLSETDIQGNPNANREIGHMLEVANDSYDLVRGTLSALKSDGLTDIHHLLTNYTRQVEERSGINIDFISQGTPQPLSPYQVRQLFYVFREGLSNIEKHAGASNVTLQMTWEDESLDLKITDNGHGFDPEEVPWNYHYGLEFMRERIRRLNGSMSIQSQASAGTKIAIHIPQDGTARPRKSPALRLEPFTQRFHSSGFPERKTSAHVQ